MSDNCSLSSSEIRSFLITRTSEPKHVQHPPLEKISDNDCAHAQIRRKHKTHTHNDQLTDLDNATKKLVALICLFKR